MGNPQIPRPMLSEGQIFNRAFDTDFDALRVNIASGSVELSVGSISLGTVKVEDGNTSNKLHVYSDGSIDTNVVLMGPDDSVALTDSTGSIINPATLSSVNNVNSTLQSIRDTLGIKKIIDPVIVIQGTTPWVVTGSVSTNIVLPDIQTITGSVGITNFPSSFDISNFPSVQTITGSVSVTGLDINNVNVSNFPSVQTITGSVKVDNFPSGTLQLVVTNAIDVVNFDLSVTSFSETTNITNDYILDNIEFHFSTNESKKITITTSSNTIIYEDTNTSQNILLSDIAQSYNANDNITIKVTKTNNECLMSCVLKVREGEPALGSNIDVNVSNFPSVQTITGSVKVDNFSTQVINAIDINSFNLALAPYSGSTNINNDYILNNISFYFSTPENKTIKIVDPTGALIYKDENTSMNLKLANIDQAFKANENISIFITQTVNPCLMNCTVRIRGIL